MGIHSPVGVSVLTSSYEHERETSQVDDTHPVLPN